jgi:hypothetical protein
METRQSAVATLRTSMQGFLDLLDGVHDARWFERPEGEEWSLAETVEHVAVTQRNIGKRLATLFDSPFPADAPRISDDGFDFAAPAPPGLAEPKGRFTTRDEGVGAFRDASDAILSWAETSAEDLRHFGTAHPVFGLLDGVQWLLFSAAHIENHVPQLRSIRAKLGR